MTACLHLLALSSRPHEMFKPCDVNLLHALPHCPATFMSCLSAAPPECLCRTLRTVYVHSLGPITSGYRKCLAEIAPSSVC